jgi:N-acetylglucosaminyl-diphospho-decaprenol L-rhamnosyltransferase
MVSWPNGCRGLAGAELGSEAQASSRGSMEASRGSTASIQSAVRVDIVIVSYNSRAELRACVEPLVGLDWARVIVVDNASTDGSLEALAGLPATAIPLAQNQGFAHGCNAGWRVGAAPAVLFLNPDARISPASLAKLVDVLARDPRIGAVGPNLLSSDGQNAFSRRRFPSLRSTYAQALFLHRIVPRASWCDEVVRHPAEYERGGAVDWIPGACLLVRRSALEQLSGFDERFFLYCEDMDLCRRIWELGLTVRFEADAAALHDGGASAPRSSVLPLLAASRAAYARKHERPLPALLHRLGFGLDAVTHMLVSRGGVVARGGHARSLRRLASSKHAGALR